MIFGLPVGFGAHVFLTVHQLYVFEIARVQKIQLCLLDPENPAHDQS